MQVIFKSCLKACSTKIILQTIPQSSSKGVGAQSKRSFNRPSNNMSSKLYISMAVTSYDSNSTIYPSFTDPSEPSSLKPVKVLDLSHSKMNILPKSQFSIKSI